MNRIKQLREEHGLTQDELGEKLCVKRAAISKYETEKIPLTDATLKLLSEVFNESTDYILGLSDLRSSDSTVISKKDIKDHDDFMAEARAMFMNGEVADEDKEKIFKDISDLFWESKKINKEKYGKKNKK